MNKRFTALALILLLALSAQPANGGNKGSKRVMKKEHELALSFNQGELFLEGRERYATLPELLGLTPNSAKNVVLGKNRNLLNTPVGNLNIVFEKAGYFITRPKAYLMAAGAQLGGMPVAINLRTLQFAIISMNILVKLKDPRQATAIADDLELRLMRTLLNNSIAVYQVTASDYLDKLQQLRSDQRVQSAQLDLLENAASPL